jgi:hypothetical protein
MRTAIMLVGGLAHRQALPQTHGRFVLEHNLTLEAVDTTQADMRILRGWGIRHLSN